MFSRSEQVGVLEFISVRVAGFEGKVCPQVLVFERLWTDDETGREPFPLKNSFGVITWIAMAPEHKEIGRSRAPLVDCTNTPPISISRPRRARGAYASPSINTQFTLKRPADPDNRANNVEDAATPTGHLRENSSSDHNFITPQAVSPAVVTSQLTEENEDEGLSDFRVYNKRCQTKGRALETWSLSCPPPRRPSSESPAVERSHKYRNQGADVRKRRPIDASTDLPESGRPKVQRRRNSMPKDGGGCTLPESFVHEQQAHYAEVDAFVLQEEELSDDSSV